MTRQRLAQLDWKRRGRCASCAEHPETLDGCKCEPCKEKERLRRGHRRWQPGSPGRPPKGLSPTIIYAWRLQKASDRVLKLRAKWLAAAEELRQLQLAIDPP